MSRRCMFVLLFGVALLAWPRSSSAQVSIWLQEGVSGAGAAASVQASDDQMIFGVDGGYSIRGFLEFDLGLGYITFPDDDDGLPDDLAGVALAPRIELHPLKQGRFPVSIGLGGSVTAYSFSSDAFDDDEELTGWSAAADASVYRFFKLASTVGITPALSIGYVHQELTAKSGFTEETSEEETANFGLGAYVAFLDPSGRIWGVAPALFVSEDSTTFALRASLVWTL